MAGDADLRVQLKVFYKGKYQSFYFRRVLIPSDHIRATGKVEALSFYEEIAAKREEDGQTRLARVLHYREAYDSGETPPPL